MPTLRLLVAALALCAACTSVPATTPVPPTATATATAAPPTQKCWVALRATYRVTSANGGEPTAADLEADRQVVESITASMGFAQLAVRTTGSSIEIDLSEPAQPDDVRNALRPGLDFQFVPIPAGLSVQADDAIPAGLPPLFGREGVASATNASTGGGQPALDLVLTDDASERLDNWAADNLGNQLAIVTDGLVISAPTVRARSFEAKMQISGGSEIQVQRLLAVLSAPALRGSLEEVGFETGEPPSGCPATPSP